MPLQGGAWQVTKATYWGQQGPLGSTSPALPPPSACPGKLWGPGLSSGQGAAVPGPLGWQGWEGRTACSTDPTHQLPLHELDPAT